MKKLKQRLDTINPFEDFEGFNKLMDEYEAYYRKHLTDEAIENGGVALEIDAHRALVTRSTRSDVKYQLTFFDKNCEPMSHKDLDEINYRDIPLGYEFIAELV